MKKFTAVIFAIILVFSNIQLGYGQGENVKYYTIQVGSYENKEIMQSTLKKLQGMGYRPHWKSEGGKYKLFLADYASKTQADNALSGLKSKGYDGYVRERSKYVSIAPKPAQTTIETESSDSKKDAGSNIKEADIASSNDIVQQVNIQMPPANGGLRSKNYKWQKDVMIQGVYGNNVFFFDMDKDWDLKDAYLNLIFSQSQLKSVENQENNDSTLTVYINKFPVYSMDLNGRDKYKEQVRVSIPTDKVVKGFNEISIRTYKRIMELPCKDDLNPANWIAFHKESYVHIDFVDKKDSASINEYPYPYLKKSDDIQPQGILVIPDDFRDCEMEAAGIISAGFGKAHRFDNLNIRAYRSSQNSPKKYSDMIFIGGSSNSPSEIISRLSDQEKSDMSNSTVIKEMNSPYSSSHKLLVVLSDDKASLVNAAKALTDGKLVSQMNSSVQIINVNTAASEKQKQDDYEYYKLKNLGYSDVLLEGLFRQQATFGIGVPKNRSIKDGAKLDIKFRYSKVLDFKKSLMTVYINDIPVGSKKLTEENADNDSFEVELPKELRGGNYFDLKIAFDLNMDDVYCNIRPQSASWAFISGESYAYLPYEYKADALLEDYDAPFVKDLKFNDIVMVVPDNPTSQELSTACGIAAFLAHSAEKVDGLTIVTSKNFSKAHESSNIIAIGTPDRNSLIKNINEGLNIKFDANFEKFISNEHMILLEKYNSNIATIQLIDSPYKSGRKMLVLTGSDQKTVINAGRYLSDFELAAKLRGNLAIIDDSGNMLYEYVGEKARMRIETEGKTSEELKSEQKTDKKDVSVQMRNFIIFMTAVLIVTVMGSAFIIRRNRK